MKAAYFNGTMKKEHDGVTRVLYRIIEEINRSKEITPLFISAIIPPENERPVEMIEVPSLALPFYKDYRIAYPGGFFFEQRLNEFKPDIIHINSPCPLGHAALYYGRKKRIPVVATYHTHFPSYAKYYNVQALEQYGWHYLRNIYNKCRAVYVPSLPVLGELQEHGFKTAEFLPHGVDNKMFSPLKKSVNWKTNLGIENKFALLFAGRLVWEKDLLTLAKSYERISGQRNDVKFVIAGDGPVKDEIKTLMPEALFLGQQSLIDLSVSFASADVFVFPSTTETFGNVILEAMASGLPPVCVREGGAYGIIQNGITGFIAEPRNPEDLTAKINLLLDDPGLRNKVSGSAFDFSQTQKLATNLSKTDK